MLFSLWKHKLPLKADVLYVCYVDILHYKIFIVKISVISAGWIVKLDCVCQNLTHSCIQIQTVAK